MRSLLLLPLLLAVGCSSEDAASSVDEAPDAGAQESSSPADARPDHDFGLPPDASYQDSASEEAGFDVATIDAAADSGNQATFFRPDSLWNTPISNEPVAWHDVPEMRSNCWWVNYKEYSNPVVWGSDSDPIVNVPAPASWGWPATELKLHVPAGVTGAVGTDASLIIISGNVAYDFWQFDRTSDSTATVTAWGQADIVTGTGWGNPNPSRGAGIRAGGSSGLAGEIYADELTKGIPHALAVAVVIETSGLAGEARPPALSGDGPMEGLRIGIPPGTEKPAGLSVQGSNAWDAMVTYGAWLADRAYGNCPVIFNADPRSVPQADIDALLKDINTIRDAVRVIDYDYPYNP